MAEKCKIHGIFEKVGDMDDCPWCAYYFWENEHGTMKAALFEISHTINEDIGDSDVIEKIQGILKEYSI